MRFWCRVSESHSLPNKLFFIFACHEDAMVVELLWKSLEERYFSFVHLHLMSLQALFKKWWGVDVASQLCIFLSWFICSGFSLALHFLLSPGDSLRADHRKLVARESHTLTAHRNGLGGVTSMNLGCSYSCNSFLRTANECLDAWMLGYKKGAWWHKFLLTYGTGDAPTSMHRLKL